MHRPTYPGTVAPAFIARGAVSGNPLSLAALTPYSPLARPPPVCYRYIPRRSQLLYPSSQPNSTLPSPSHSCRYGMAAMLVNNGGVDMAHIKG